MRRARPWTRATTPIRGAAGRAPGTARQPGRRRLQRWPTAPAHGTSGWRPASNSPRRRGRTRATIRPSPGRPPTSGGRPPAPAGRWPGARPGRGPPRRPAGERCRGTGTPATGRPSSRSAGGRPRPPARGATRCARRPSSAAQSPPPRGGRPRGRASAAGSGSRRPGLGSWGAPSGAQRGCRHYSGRASRGAAGPPDCTMAPWTIRGTSRGRSSCAATAPPRRR